MTQLGLGLDLSTKRTRKREFLDEMTRVVPWQKLIALIEPHTTLKARLAARRFRLRRCCAFTSCMYGPDAFYKLSFVT